MAQQIERSDTSAPGPMIYTAASAAKRALLSKTSWGRKGRVLKEGAASAGIVSQQEEVQSGIGVYPVIRELGDDCRLVSTHYFEVYSESQTEEKATRKATTRFLSQKKKSSPSPSPLTPSFVSPEAKAFDVTTLENRVFTSNSDLHGSPPPKKALNKKPWAYVPGSLTDKDKAELGPDLDLALCVMHLVYYFRVRSQKGRHDWVELSRDYCIHKFGGRSGSNWYRVRDRMLALGMLQMTREDIKRDEYGLGVEVADARGLEGHLCYGYRLREDLRMAATRRTPLNDPRAVKISQGSRVCGYTLRWLERNLHQVTMEPVSAALLLDIARQNDDPAVTAESRAEAFSETVRWIAEGAWYCEVDGFSGRIHTNLTGLKREFRPYLRVAGQPLCQIDIPCSQLGFIGLAARAAEKKHRKQFLDAHFFEVWERDLYTYLGERLGVSRQEVKLHLTQRALFSSNRSHHQRSRVKLQFDREFPLLAGYIKMVKNSRPKATDDKQTRAKPYRVLAQKAQVAERRFVIDAVCSRLRRERPEMWANTIHDSVVVLSDDADFAKSVMLDEFGKLGLHPSLRVEHYLEDSGDTCGKSDNLVPS